jgi:ligand-binding SRPBCC domain-containing protein
MPIIELNTEINASLEICFDLSRSIDLHKMSTQKTKEKAIAGITTGLIGLNETVTWQATHFGIQQKLSSKITAFNRPYSFTDEQIKGIFKVFHHEHQFIEVDNKVVMVDKLHFQSPLGIIGSLFDKLILTEYLRRFLIERNKVIKEFAESDKWKHVLNPS